MLSFLVANCHSMQSRADKTIKQNDATLSEIESTRDYIAMADMKISDKARIYQTLDKCEASVEKSSDVTSSCAKYSDKIWFWRKAAFAGWGVVFLIIMARMFLPTRL